MKKYLAYNGIDSEYEDFDTIKEAREYLEECFLDRDEGYHPDLESCCIFCLEEKVEYKVIAEREYYTNEEWEEEYNSNFDEIWEHKFIKCK